MKAAASAILAAGVDLAHLVERGAFFVLLSSLSIVPQNIEQVKSLLISAA